MAKEKKYTIYSGSHELPGGVKLRPLMLVCYLVIVFGVMALVPNVIGGWGRCGQTGCCGTDGCGRHCGQSLHLPYACGPGCCPDSRTV